MRLYFWQEVLSPHQSDFILELSKIKGNEIFWIVEKRRLDYRTKMGWEDVSISSVNIIISPTKTEVKNILIESKFYKSIHIFSGTRGVKLVRYAFKLACKTKLKVAIQSESIDMKGFKGLMRMILGFIDKFLFSHKITYVFAIGNLGRKWFEFLGYEKNKIFDWGYFPNPDFIKNESLKFDDTKFNFIYCGSLLKGKGVINLLYAFYNIYQFNPKTHLHIVGIGKELNKIKSLIEQFKISDNVTLHGVLLNKQAKYLISNADVLILPSIIKDGWGAVVNEAILNGTRVICSDMCGSSIIIKNNSTFGRVFEHKHTQSLIDSMSELLTKGKLDETERLKLIEKSRNILTPSAVSKYFYSVINENKFIKAPWLI